MIVKLLTERHLKFQSIIGGCTGSHESTLVKMPHCWKSHVSAHLSSCLSLGLPHIGSHGNITVYALWYSHA